MDILRQTLCMDVNLIMIDNFPSLFNCMMVGRSSVCSLLNLFQMVGTWP